MASVPRMASTVALVRDGENGLETVLMRRHSDDRFLPEYDVFPGGALDPGDRSVKPVTPPKQGDIRKFGGTEDELIAHLICGIRETFEESGLLLAVDDNGNFPEILQRDDVKKFSEYRKLVFKHDLSFGGMLEMEKLKPATDRLFYLDRWITPSYSDIRYDARFFAAVAPVNQLISHDGDELTGFSWMTPRQALTENRTGSINLVLPTVSTIEFLSRFRSVEEFSRHFSF